MLTPAAAAATAIDRVAARWPHGDGRRPHRDSESPAMPPPLSLPHTRRAAAPRRLARKAPLVVVEYGGIGPVNRGIRGLARLALTSMLSCFAV